MENEIMETEIVEKENKGLIITSKNGNSYQMSDENAEKLLALAGEVGKEYVLAKKDAFIAELQKEADIQVSAMEKTVSAQKDVLDAHERVQHDLLERYTAMRERLIDLLGKSQTPDQKAGTMKVLEDVNRELEMFYIDNNKKLDAGLEQVKQRPKGIIGQFLSRLGL